jgi:hypothetical protein
MLDKPQLQLALRPVYTILDIEHAIKQERKRTRAVIRIIWFTAMVVTVMVAAVVRKQPWIEGLAWWWVPIAAVTTNALYFWTLHKLLFRNNPYRSR